MCGATSYRRVIDRDEAGALRPTDLFQCSGCTLVFVDPRAWRDGDAEPVQRSAADGITQLMPAIANPASTAPAGPDLRTYGMVPCATAGSNRGV